MKDIFTIDYITKISYSDEVNHKLIENFNKSIKNVRKYRSRIERRKEKIKRLYE